ncbi:MAG: hypothetical protein FWE57_03270 [Chitinispirillia bacterium]|nr:hypothetical protein [Chitinispirillia bacterium]
MEPRFLNELLRFSDEELRITKIKLNVTAPNDTGLNGTHPMNVFIRNPEEINHEWLFWRKNNHTFNIGQYAVCFVRMGEGSDHRWLLTTIKKVTHRYDSIREGTAYSGEILTRFEKYFGRVIVRYRNSSKNICRYANNFINDLEISQILPRPYSLSASQ